MTIPPLVNPYCTLDDVQKELQNNDADEVPSLLTAINQASRAIDWYCGRDFMYHDHTTTPLTVLNIWCSANIIYLPWPVIELSEVTVADGFGVPAILPVSDYGFIRNPLSPTGQVIRSGRWLAGDLYSDSGLLSLRTYGMPRQITLKGKFGYALAVDPAAPSTTPGFSATAVPSPNIPMDISIACTVIASVRSGKARRDLVDFSGNRTSQTLRTVPKDVMAMVMRYKMGVV